ncbi:MAG: hypothetical protein ABJN22_13675 [Litorimonas sp.]
MPATLMDTEPDSGVKTEKKLKGTSLEQRMLGVMAAFAVTWGLLCLLGFTLGQIASPEELSRSYSPTQIAYIQDTPGWVLFGKAMTTIGTLCGAVYLLLRKKSAYHWFSISLVGTLMIMADSVLRDGFHVLGGIGTGVSLGMVIAAIFLFWASYSAFYEGQLED